MENKKNLTPKEKIDFIKTLLDSNPEESKTNWFDPQDKQEFLQENLLKADTEKNIYIAFITYKRLFDIERTSNKKFQDYTFNDVIYLFQSNNWVYPATYFFYRMKVIDYLKWTRANKNGLTGISVFQNIEVSQIDTSKMIYKRFFRSYHDMERYLLSWFQPEEDEAQYTDALYASAEMRTSIFMLASCGMCIEDWSTLPNAAIQNMIDGLLLHNGHTYHIPSIYQTHLKKASSSITVPIRSGKGTYRMYDYEPTSMFIKRKKMGNRNKRTPQDFNNHISKTLKNIDSAWKDKGAVNNDYFSKSPTYIDFETTGIFLRLQQKLQNENFAEPIDKTNRIAQLLQDPCIIYNLLGENPSKSKLSLLKKMYTHWEQAYFIDILSK